MTEEPEAKRYTNLAEIVNPENRSLRVYYPGSGGDLLTPLLTTNSDRFVYVDENTISQGFAGPFDERMKKEAKSLGIENIVVQENGKQGRINFQYRHKQDKALRKREIVFYARNAFTFWPPELNGGYDVLITRGEAPDFDSHDVQMRQLGKKLAVGGFYISDREISQYLLPEWLGFKEIPTDVVFPCGNARLYRKDRQESLGLLSLLFRFQDRFSDLDSFVRGDHDYTAYKRISPEEALQIELQTGEKVDDHKKFKRDWEQMIVKLKQDFEKKLLRKARATSKVFSQLPPDIQESLRQRLPELRPIGYEFFREFGDK